MASIKENIKQALLSYIYAEEDNLMQRQALSESSQESFQCTCERNFLSKLKEFVESL